jgi:predicted metal-dependent HD superfamily phosphohydrolase
MSALDQNRWRTLWQSIPAAGGDPRVWFDLLSAHYAEPHRHYHTARHIAECLAELDASRRFAADAVAVELALWFHDAIYDTHAADNEDKSADLAGQCLEAARAGAALKSAVRDLVLVTRTHAARPESDSGLLIDIDLSILGKDEARFWEYEAQIREEYRWVSDENFASGRAAILERFLSRDRLYVTEFFFQRYENQARSNLRASLARLRA